MRGLDHIVHLVVDLEAAAQQYQQCGFSVGARNKHPWGTHNRLVQFEGFFIELLEVAEPERIPPVQAGEFSFGKFNVQQKHEGVSMLALEGAQGDYAAFQACGLGGYAPFSFKRQGEKGEVGFDLVFARFNLPQNSPYLVPNFGFFTCKQLAPQNFWQNPPPNPQKIQELVFVSENPADYAQFFGKFIDNPFMQANSMGILIETARGAVRITDSLTFTQMFGEKPVFHAPLSLAAVVFSSSHAAFQHKIHQLLLVSRG